MSVTILALVALAVSSLFILILCLGDPKRLRAAGIPGKAMSSPQRRLLAAALCLPGVALALSGDAAAFMLWLGGCVLVGWAAALWLRSARS